jgi:hypothetical protein
MNETALQALTALLWPDGDHLKGPQVYWLLDGARDPDIAALVRTGGLEFTCLFSGALHPDLQAAAPYLVHLAAGSPTTNRLLLRGWGKAWGILTVAAPDVTLVQQRLHFKKFLRVRTEDGRELAFRYYDPRVLNIYLPTCTPDEFHTLLGPLTALVAEQPGGGSLRMFGSDGTGMLARELPVEGMASGSGR